MKTFKKILSGVVLLGAVAALASVQAQQGPMGANCMGDGANPGVTQCMGRGVGHGMRSGMGPSVGSDMMSGSQMLGQMKGPTANMTEMRQLMTDEERTAMHEKMRAAKTPEERQTLRAANHAEMEKRAKEKGITFPMQHQQMMSGRQCG